VKRKISAILAADIAGYSRLVALDEEDTLARLATYRSVFDDFVARWGGRIFSAAGDAVLAEFPSSVDAVRCALDVQEGIRTRNLAHAADRQMLYRIGVTVADVVERDGDLLGDGVNIAARLGGIAIPGGICVSRAVYEQVGNKISVKFEDLGQQQVKNIPHAIHAYGIAPHPDAFEVQASPAKHRARALAALALAAAVTIALGVVALQTGAWWPSSSVATAPATPQPAGRDVGPSPSETKIRALAARQNIPLPPTLKVMAAAAGLPPALAGYLGGWGGDQGWNGNGRQIILVIESIDESGTALGVLAFGPALDPNNADRRPARYRSIAGSITDAGLGFNLGGAKYTFRDTADGLMWGRWQPQSERPNVELTITLERID
jgi:class 3 adenylate cyclase